MGKHLLIFLAICSCNISAYVLQQIISPKQKFDLVRLNMEDSGGADMSSSLSSKKRGARVAFVGNSIQYFNDTPRFLTRLSQQTQSYAVIPDEPYDAFIQCQDSCFRGGVNLVGLWQQGNGMLKHGYASVTAINGADDDEKMLYDVGSPTVQDLLAQEDWDFVVMNDHTQGPTRKGTRDATIDTLIKCYAPLIAKCGAVPIIIETAAYRLEGINNSHDLGNTQTFQQKVRQGVRSYLDAIQTELPEAISPRLAPVGAAYLYVFKNNFALWEQLFDSFDNFHPSPKGTFLQGCVLFHTMFSSLPPIPQTDEEIAELWRDARMMNCVNRTDGYEVMPLPTVEEANYLCHVVKLIC